MRPQGLDDRFQPVRTNALAAVDPASAPTDQTVNTLATTDAIAAAFFFGFIMGTVLQNHGQTTEPQSQSASPSSLSIF